MTRPTNRFIKIGVTLAACFATSLAFAGFRTPLQVVVTGTTSGNFSGTIGAARYSSDTAQYIGCETYTAGSTVMAYCYAQNSTGDASYRSCETSEPNFTAVAANVTGTTYLAVGFNSDGSCSTIQVDNGSENIY